MVAIQRKRPQIPDEIVEAYTDFVKIIDNCWNEDPLQRPSFESLLSIFAEAKYPISDNHVHNKKKDSKKIYRR